MMRLVHTLKLGQYHLRQWIAGMFVYPRKTLDAVALSYDDYWSHKRPGETIVLSPMERARAHIVARGIGVTGGTIGDIGAGPGVVLKEILELCPGTKGIAYDSSARAREYAAGIGIESKVLDLRDRASLDAVAPADYYVLLEVLEHVPNSEEVLSTLMGKCAKGVYVSVPNTGFLKHRFRLLFGKAPAQWVDMPNEHLRFWTIVDVRWWLRAQGYQHFSITPYGGIPVLNRLWPNLCAMGMVVFISRS